MQVGGVLLTCSPLPGVYLCIAVYKENYFWIPCHFFVLAIPQVATGKNVALIRS